MHWRQLTHKIFLILFLSTALLALEAYSPPFESSKESLLNVVPAVSPLLVSQANVYTPEFSLNADSVVVPLKRAGHLFLIEAKVGDEAGNLVFDSGANGLVLNSTYFRNHVRSGGATPTGVTGAVGIVEQIAVSRLEFADVLYKNVTADITSLGHIENRRGIKILGLIGFSMMKKLEIVIDAKNSQLKLFKIDKAGKRINSSIPEFRADYKQKIEGNTNILFLKGIIGGKSLNFCLDTGCETNVICSDCNRSIMNTLTITRRSEVIGAGIGGSEVLFGRMNDFTMGNKKMPNMDTIVTNLDALSESYGTKIDGMLGYNFLLQGVICINFVNRQFGIRFTKGDEK